MGSLTGIVRHTAAFSLRGKYCVVKWSLAWIPRMICAESFVDFSCREQKSLTGIVTHTAAFSLRGKYCFAKWSLLWIPRMTCSESFDYFTCREKVTDRYCEC